MPWHHAPVFKLHPVWLPVEPPLLKFYIGVTTPCI